MTAIGGAPEFFAFLRDGLIPSMEAKYNVSASDRAWVGYSVGALFGLYGLLKDGSPFQRFLLGSPSIVFADHVINRIEGENHFSGPPAAFSRGLRSIYQNVSESGSK